jgi:hypothetical protein
MSAETNPACSRCNDGWICDQHPDRGWSHGDCAGPSVPCPRCNRQSPPRLPSDSRNQTSRSGLRSLPSSGWMQLQDPVAP